jgi:GNAT superfamily N-acetyltransferase
MARRLDRMIPDEVRALAENPVVYGPLPPGFERILEDGYCIFIGPMPQMTMVQRLRLSPREVEVAVERVRALAGDRQRPLVTWWIGDSATPEDLESRLLALGLEPPAMPVSEPRYAALALVEPPKSSSRTPVARRVQSFEEFVTAGEITQDAFEHTEEQRASRRDIEPMLYELEQQDVTATYLAFVDGEPVGAATAVFADAGVMLLGGATLPHARGRGCYRALVQARWEDAVRRGTPALVVQAGVMSRPILEGLGFQLVSDLRVLVDELE